MFLKFPAMGKVGARPRLPRSDKAKRHLRPTVLLHRLGLTSNQTTGFYPWRHEGSVARVSPSPSLGSNMSFRLAWVWIALPLLLFPLSALAGLGANASLVETDRVQLDANLRSAEVGALTQFELQLPSGTTVREYASAGGAVFAVTWDGPTLPNLRQLFGAFFQQYLDASQGGGLGAQVVRQPGLVVYSGGHMRAFHGRAYLPQLQPQGVSAESLP